jgi:beta-glucosidase
LTRDIFISYFEGTRGAEAVADVLFGDYNPNGKLPITYPKSPNGFTTYDHTYLDAQSYDPLFEFGHGLSYTSFRYENLELNPSVLNFKEDILRISIQLTNTGSLEGKETILVYLSDEFASICRPNKQLKRFAKINLKPNESQRLEFIFSIDDLKFTDKHNRRIAEKGYFTVKISNLSSRFYLSESF